MPDPRHALTRQVKEANDIVAVVGSYLPLTPAGAVFKAVCPFHNDTRPSLDVNPRRQRYRCWACGKFGDVFSFVQEFEKVDFIQARAVLARRVNISLDGDAKPDGRVRLLEAIKWADAQYRHVLLESPVGQAARDYLASRGFADDTVWNWGLGFAPVQGDWLVRLANRDGVSFDALAEVGVIARRTEGNGFFDRFRDRVMFPIRDTRGQTVGFGGRVLPGSPLAARGPKYYNSAETPLFSKSELIYGLDKAREAGGKCGYLAVVEGYTDVIMAHQCGVPQVVATMGTALNARHIRQLSRHVPKVVLVFDADAGGTTGIDRALEIFVREDVELAVASLPDGMDPFDLLVARGAGPFAEALDATVDALDFKLGQLIERETLDTVEAQRRVVDAILGVAALMPEDAGQAGRVKLELLINRVSHRLRLRHETVWARLEELQRGRRERDAKTAERGRPAEPAAPASTTPSGPARPLERQLIELLLADPDLVRLAHAEVRPEEIRHAGVRRLLEGLYALHEAGEVPDLDALRPRLERPALATRALELQEVGASVGDKLTWLRRTLAEFAKERVARDQSGLRDALAQAPDHEQALALLRAFQERGRALDSSSPRTA